MRRSVQGLSASSPLGRRLGKLFRYADADPAERLASYFLWISQDTLAPALSPAMRESMGVHRPVDLLLRSLEGLPTGVSRLNLMLHLDRSHFLADHNLNYTDKMAMAVGVEARVPYLDKDLVHFSQTLPPELKMKGNTTKYLLKKVAERYLPKDIIYRPKTGFGAPVRKWILEDMKSFLEDELSEIKIKKNGIFNYTEVRKLIEDNRSGKIDAAYTIWAVLAVTSWANQFYSKDK
jgi:asparagine synthase (glutamine-hydrolysing)